MHGQRRAKVSEYALAMREKRAGYARTRRQARQGVNHGHFLVNGRRVDIVSYLVRPGDVVAVPRRAAVRAFYRHLRTEGRHNADRLAGDAETLAFTVTRLPAAGDVNLPVEVTKVIELLTR
jgi:small subunit ribosomal protein S4